MVTTYLQRYGNLITLYRFRTHSERFLLTKSLLANIVYQSLETGQNFLEYSIVYDACCVVCMTANLREVILNYFKALIIKTLFLKIVIHVHKTAKICECVYVTNRKRLMVLPNGHIDHITIQAGCVG
jgi:hypothetical protein